MGVIFGSIDALQWAMSGCILDPKRGPGDHSIIGPDLSCGSLIGCKDLR